MSTSLNKSAQASPAGSAAQSPADSQAPAHIALCVVQVVFGLFPAFGKLAMEGFAPTVVAGWRMAVGASAFGLLGLLIYRRRFWPGWKDLLILQVGAWLGITLNQVLFLQGLNRSTAVDAGLIVCMIPIFTISIAMLIRQESVFPRRLIGIATAFGGCLVLFLAEGALQSGREHSIGNLMMVTNTLCFSIYLVLTKPIMRRLPALAVIAWVYILSAWQIPWIVGDQAWIPADVTQAEWNSMIFVLLGPTLVAYLLNAFALSRVAASTIAVYTYAQPIITGVAGVYLLGESLRPQVPMAAVLIFLGIGLVASRPARRPASTLAVDVST